MYNSPQTIVSSVPRGDATDLSLHHCKYMNLIFNIFKDPEDWNKTKITVYCDELPYTVKQEIKIDFEIYWATCATDRRSDSDQSQNRIAVFGFSKPHDFSNKLVKIELDDNNELTYSVSDEEFETELLKCMIVSDTRLLSFRL